ncbi:MAG TPA: hypothetical protein DEQ39_02810 [Atlantibacter hermannii]|nr:hypothetical protein [Atlantibacter hermannii]
MVAQAGQPSGWPVLT